MDLVGHADRPIRRGTSTPGTVSVTPGGVARNIAENLARMGCPVRLVGAVGADALSRSVLEQTAQAGVDVTTVSVLPGRLSGVYLSIFAAGELDRAIADTGATEDITGTMMREVLTQAADRNDAGTPASLLVLDTNLTSEALQAALDWAAGSNVPVLVEPVSEVKCRRLFGLHGVIDFITPNTGEARELLARREHSAGFPVIRNWVITRGPAGAALWSKGDRATGNGKYF